LRVSQGAVIETEWKQDRDVPLTANGTLVAWAAFEVVGEQLAVRITDLA
jgi:flagellar motor switch/type III secretory pathway protein FliN